MTQNAVNELIIRPCTLNDAEGIIEVWRTCGLLAPQNDPWQDIRIKLRLNDGLFLVALTENDGAYKVVGTIMGGYDGHRGWIYYLAVLPERQRSGLGRKLLGCMTDKLQAMGCPKINLQIRETNIQCRGFYESLGFAQDAVVSYGKRLDG